jgi:glycosyltransferase involved in cell wall biosynthesis
VATAVNGTAEAVKEGVTGRLLPAGDVAGLAAALVELGRSPRMRRRMGIAGRAASARFGVDRFSRDTLRVYRAA